MSPITRRSFPPDPEFDGDAAELIAVKACLYERDLVGVPQPLSIREESHDIEGRRLQCLHEASALRLLLTLGSPNYSVVHFKGVSMQINARRSSLFSIPIYANLVSHSIVACFLAVFGFVSATSLRAQATPSDEQISQKVEALLSRMTLEEKIGQLTQIAGGLLPGANPEEVVRKGGAGSILWLNDTKRFNEIQHVAVEESRLHVPVLFGLDVIHGYRTIFPVP
ncbi:MAG: glycoside hydrolase family 3 N-terminal domain-containing protein, partial [Acidobacteriota bacterium]